MLTDKPFPLDWNDIRFFLAVSRERTLARAASALGVDQTTVGRRIASLEARLHVALFARSSGGFTLTEAGTRALEAAARMEQSALELSVQAAGEDDPQGTVRIAAPDALAERFVVPALCAVHARHPNVHAVIVTGWSRVDLRRGDADLAVRIERPTDPHLAFRKLSDLSLRLYASRDFVARRGSPVSLEGHPLLGHEDAVRATGHAFTDVPDADGGVALQTNSGHLLVAAAVAGLGIVQLPSYVGDSIPELLPVLPALETRHAVWLAVPQAKKLVAAVRIVAEAIDVSFKSEAPRAPSRTPRLGADGVPSSRGVPRAPARARGPDGTSSRGGSRLASRASTAAAGRDPRLPPA
jgi:DNA-binding transcriptional LysR family regulator